MIYTILLISHFNDKLKVALHNVYMEVQEIRQYVILPVFSMTQECKKKQSRHGVT